MYIQHSWLSGQGSPKVWHPVLSVKSNVSPQPEVIIEAEVCKPLSQEDNYLTQIKEPSMRHRNKDLNYLKTPESSTVPLTSSQHLKMIPEQSLSVVRGATIETCTENDLVGNREHRAPSLQHYLTFPNQKHTANNLQWNNQLLNHFLLH